MHTGDREMITGTVGLDFSNQQTAEHGSGARWPLLQDPTWKLEKGTASLHRSWTKQFRKSVKMNQRDLPIKQ